jgi:hypothetical protein
VTVISLLITDAFREGNILPLGKAPTDNQVTEALRLYQQNIRSIYGGDAGENLTDWPLGSFAYDEPQLSSLSHADCIQRPRSTNRADRDEHRSAQDRLFDAVPAGWRSHGDCGPVWPARGFPVTLDANGRTIEGNPTVVLNVNGTFQEWFYRADKGNWVKLTSLSSRMKIRSRMISIFSSFAAWRCGSTPATAAKWTPDGNGVQVQPPAIHRALFAVAAA